MIQKHTRNTPSHLSDFDSTNARRQEGSITIAFAKSISSVSRAINLQLWTWYHVTLWYYVEYNMKLPYCCWSVYLAGYFTGLEMLRERLLRARASLLSSAHDVSLSFILSLSLCHLSRDRRPRQAASWWRLTGTTSRDTNSIRGSRGKTLHVTTHCAYHCT